MPVYKYKGKANNLQEVLLEVEESLGWKEEINFKEVIKDIIQRGVDLEFIELRGYNWYERIEEKGYYANGRYPIYLKTRYGEIRIEKPRYRGESFRSEVIENYRQKANEINFAILEAYLLGTSLRKTAIVSELFSGLSISHQTIANLLEGLDKEVIRFRNERITDKFKYIYLDGMSIKVRDIGKMKKFTVLMAYGVTDDEKKRLIDFNLAKTEGEENWTRFINHLGLRGLDFDDVQLIVSDRAGGILETLINYYPLKPHQICIFHKIANLNKYLNSRKNRRKILGEASECYEGAKSKEEFVERLEKFQGKWEDKEKRAVQCFVKDYEKTLTYFDFPKVDWSLLTTNNPLERYIEKIRGRVKTMRCFKSLKSAERIIGLLILNEEKRLNKDMLSC
jgi:transposase-like protein